MRVGLVLDESLDPPDGIQQYLLQIGSWLSQRGHSVYYLVGETKRTEPDGILSLSKNIKVKFNGNWLSMPLPVSKHKLRTVLNGLELDVLHVQTPYSPFMAGRMMKLASQNTAVVGTFHILPYSWMANVGSVGLRLLNTRSARRFDAVVAVSEPASKFAAAKYGLECSVIPNTFDYERFATAAPKDTKQKIVFLGRLVERKGIMYLLQSLALLQKEQRLPSDWRIVVGGKGPLREQLEQYCQDNNLSSVVEFAGFISEGEKAAFLAGADIAVFPSTGGESFGISLIEAMAASRGVVLAGNNPGYASVMEGFEDQLITPQDIAQFADAIAFWVEHPKERTAQASKQRRYVRRFDITVVGPAVESMYTKALQSRHRP